MVPTVPGRFLRHRDKQNQEVLAIKSNQIVQAEFASSSALRGCEGQPKSPKKLKKPKTWNLHGKVPQQDLERSGVSKSSVIEHHV